MQARGTFLRGFSTASEFCAADSRPRKAQSVMAMLEPIPSSRPSPCGFQAAAKVSLRNQNHPKSERPATGSTTPHTVTEEMRPVAPGPPKLGTVVNQIRAITPMQVALGVDESQGANAARYPTAEVAIATLPIAIERK